MPPLEKRVSALEDEAGIHSEGRPKVVFRCIAPAKEGKPAGLTRAKFAHLLVPPYGQVRREDGESEEAFLDRVDKAIA